MSSARPAREWRLRPRGDADAAQRAEAVARRLGVSPLVARILIARGVGDPEAMETFLVPNLRHLPQPGELPGLQAAAECLAASLAAGKKLAVWGDFDVDGVTATALMLDFLAQRGYSAVAHIPDRLEEGYGLNTAGIEALAAQGVGTLLTVDCGIAAGPEVARASELGMEVVVSDHHLPGDQVPECPVCNPKLADSPFEHLAGVGVAFYLACALNRMLPGEAIDVRPLLDLVALGTLADVVELSGVNRILVKNGLLYIKSAQRPGIYALKEAAGYGPLDELSAGQVVFHLAPRLNAAGRLGHAGQALELLLAPDRAAGRPLAQFLDEQNRERRREEERITELALAQAEAKADQAGLVLYGEDWHPGVVGIVASRVVERHYKPTLVLCRDETAESRLKGSGRSIRELDLYQALCDCSGVLQGFGGHRLAAGLRLSPERLAELEQRFHEAVVAQVGSERLAPSLHLDEELPLAELNLSLIRALELLAPFGQGNPEPVFASQPLQVRARRTFGKNHVLLSVRCPASGVTLQAKAWRMAEELGRQVEGRTIRLAFTPRIDTYGGIPTIELNVKDWRLEP